MVPASRRVSAIHVQTNREPKEKPNETDGAQAYVVINDEDGGDSDAATARRSKRVRTVHGEIIQ